MDFVSNVPKFSIIKITTGVIVCAISVKYIHHKISNLKEWRHLEKLRQKRRQERQHQFDKLRAQYEDLRNSKDYEKITSLTLKQLQEALFKGDLLAENVSKAYIVKSLIVQDEFNCITEFIPSALEKAQELDNMHMVKGPLHGIPFCVKDDTKIEGLDSTLGCSQRLYHPSEETATIIQSLENLGAIPFCRTNLPQTCVSFGSSNPIFGKTLNPLNKKLGPGGSSSGTGCLVAAGGSPFGTGSDSGGSLRVPAHFCGISTLKATSPRLSLRGCMKCCGNLPGIPGILAKTTEDVALVFQALTDNNLQNRMDGKVVPISWNSQIFESKQKQRIGYFTGLSQFPPIGDTESVILRAKTYLESTGHILVPFEIPCEVFQLISTLPVDDDLRERFQTLLRNDEIDHSIKDMYQSVMSSSWKQFLPLRDFIPKFLPTRKPVQPCNEMPGRDDLIHYFLDLMDKEELDLIICPVFPFPAIRIDDVPFFIEVVIYTILWNWLDFPVGVVKFWTESGKNWKSSVEALDKPKTWKDTLLNNEEDVIGMPIGVQVVGRPYQEELVLKTMVELDDINRP